ncbi:Flp pilus assembly protein CpaB [Rhodobacter calidifons]|uniref:Flp pilus assembly protein CpaB n=1 Tax=Rhodobacter calidifons TaxID=2715277 RepID=A0ABX0GAJ7_9RHOB|nr:Flp pilus assembly protein CpaB [Rhodobacter calidifons]NHB78296.1 Flp pilus assembly protein CpaB [Rhodobacter calidifons]
MRAVFALVLIVGMALAGVAVYMIQGYMAELEGALRKEQAFNAKAGKLVEVFVFAKPKKYGEPLAEKDVVAIYWPEKSLPATIFRDKAALFPENAKGPRYILRSTEAFEPVLASRVTEPGELANLTSKLEKGKRAFAIKVGTNSGISNFVKPDDYIDILWTGNVPGVEGGITRQIESAVLVIAVDKAINEGQVSSDTVAQTVTVAATPEQVARLAQAQATGKLTLSLARDASETVEGTVETDINSMLGIVRQEEAPVEVVPEVKKCYAKQRSGGQVIETDIEIPCSN